MSCQLKNTIGPSQIQCSFPEVADGKGDFSVYFNPFDGPAAQLMVTCTHNGRYACIPDEVVVTHENLNTATITVTETFANKNGTFSCQRGDLPVTNKCQFPFFENVHPTNSFNSEVDHAMTPHGVSTLKPEQFEEGDDSTAATIIGVTVGVVVLLILIVIIGLLLYRRYKFKKCLESPKNLKTNGHVSTLGEPQKNDGIGNKSGEGNIKDSRPEDESGSSSSGSGELYTPLMSRAEWRNHPV